MNLDDLGPRIVILGPSNSGKSTLAAAIERATGIPVVYLDQLRFVAGAHWVERPDDEFGELHDAAIEGDAWIMEGSYSKWLPQRLERATGLVILDATTGASLTRYVTRTLRGGVRAGGLDGVRDRLSWDMIHWILGPGSRRIRRRNRNLFAESPLPKVYLRNRRALERFYSELGLTR